MENLDLLVLRSLRDWRLAGHGAVFATVVHTWGSSPRPVGSTLALRADGVIVGSVSGGCIEDDLARTYANLAGKAAAEEPSNGPRPPQFVRYGVSADEAHRFGLPCGGTLQLLLEFDPEPGSLAELVEALQAGRLVSRTVSLADGRATLADAVQPAALYRDENVLTNTFGPEYRMLIIGAGQLSEYVATMAIFSGFSVTVCEPRETYRATWSVPGVELTAEMPDDVVLGFNADRRTCIIALTHDPKLDDLALMDAIHTDAFYVGGIGSRRNNAARRQRLMEHFGETEESLAALRGPIGIYIGSKTPPEIAISVMAEILAVKNGVALPRSMDVAAAKDQLGQAESQPASS